MVLFSLTLSARVFGLDISLLVEVRARPHPGLVTRSHIHGGAAVCTAVVNGNVRALRGGNVGGGS